MQILDLKVDLPLKIHGSLHSDTLNHYHPQRSCEGYVFTPVCLSTGGGACLPQCMLGYHPPEQTPRDQTPPTADGYCCGRYASYWNAFLFLNILDNVSVCRFSTHFFLDLASKPKIVHSLKLPVIPKQPM